MSEEADDGLAPLSVCNALPVNVVTQQHRPPTYDSAGSRR